MLREMTSRRDDGPVAPPRRGTVILAVAALALALGSPVALAATLLLGIDGWAGPFAELGRVRWDIGGALIGGGLLLAFVAVLWGVAVIAALTDRPAGEGAR